MMAAMLVFKSMIRLATSKPYDMMIKVMVTKMKKRRWLHANHMI